MSAQFLWQLDCLEKGRKIVLNCDNYKERE